MTPNEYVKLAVVTESDNFSNQSLIGKITKWLFLRIHSGTLSSRMVSSRAIRLNHAFIGIATEMEELLGAMDKEGSLDRVNVMEEVADALWYCAIASNELEMDLDKAFPLLGMSSAAGSFQRPSLSEEENRAMIEKEIRESIKISGRLLDLMKKSVFYGKQLNQSNVEFNLIHLLSHLNSICDLAGYSIETAMVRNIKKLAKRYQGKFSNHFANNRNLTLERQILEGN